MTKSILGKRNFISGIEAENICKKFLLEQSYVILAERYKSKFGEVDIICIDQDNIVFVEVKKRKLRDFNIISSKQKSRIIECAKYFLSINEQYQILQPRFDLLVLNNSEITHFTNIFEEVD